MDTTGKQCPDCGQPLKAIKILDNARIGVRPAEGELTYMAPEAKRSFWSGRYPVEGKVAACMCDGCGRILLYGEPGEGEGT
jgi:hypothetical protein